MKKILFIFLSLFFVGGLSVNAKTLSVDLSKLPATSENTTWAWDSEKSEGTFAWSGTSYNSTELFGIGNYATYTKLNLVTEDGTANHFRIIIKFTNGASQVTINPVATGKVSITLSEYVTLENLAAVQTIRLSGANDVTGDVTVSQIYLEGPDINYIEEKTIQVTPEGTVDLNGIAGTGDAWSIIYPVTVADATLFGSFTIDADVQSANIADYDYLLFAVTEASADAKTYLRVFVSTEKSDGNATRVCLYPHPIADYASIEDWTAETTITEPGVYVVKISDYPLLRGVKNKAYWQGAAGSIKVSLAYVGKGSPVAPVYKVVRVGEEALTDPNATCFDVTRLEETGLTFNATNLNALFIAKDGQLTNPNNVIVDGVCANLELTDGCPFKAPANFTATKASYSTTINAEAGFATLCLPFAAAIPAGVEANTLVYNGGEKVTATPVETTIPANTPVLISGSGMKEFAGSSVAIDADADPVVGSLTGVFQDTTVPQNSYVLQNGTSGLGFYKVESDDIVAKPFRAYLTTLFLGARGFIGIDEPTGVNEVNVNKAAAKTGKIYNLNGQIVSKPSKGLYIVDGKVVSF